MKAYLHNTLTNTCCCNMIQAVAAGVEKGMDY